LAFARFLPIRTPMAPHNRIKKTSRISIGALYRKFTIRQDPIICIERKQDRLVPTNQTLSDGRPTAESLV
jgi:hypothetical protein